MTLPDDVTRLLTGYHGPWNLLPRAWDAPWSCTLHGPAEGRTCQPCHREAAEHVRACGPSMSCAWWQARMPETGRTGTDREPAPGARGGIPNRAKRDIADTDRERDRRIRGR